MDSLQELEACNEEINMLEKRKQDWEVPRIHQEAV